MLFAQPVLLLAGLDAGLAIGRPGTILPAPETGTGHLGVKLEGVGSLAIAHRLVGERVGRGQQFGAAGDGEFVEMALADMEFAGEQRLARLGRADGVIAELVRLAVLRPDPGAQNKGDRLRPLADAQQRDIAWTTAGPASIP